MAAVVRGLLGSQLAQRYRLAAITMHRPGSLTQRAALAIRGLVALVVWCARHPRGIVHVHAAVRGSLWRKGVAVAVARVLGHPVVLHLHAGPGDIAAFASRLGRPGRFALGRVVRWPHAVVSVSESGARALCQAFGRGATDVIPNAPPAVVAPEPPMVGMTVLYLGGFDDPAKGGLDLVSVLPALLSADVDVRFVLAGPGAPPAALAEHLGPRVQWRGWLDEPAKDRALREAAVVVLPSRSEGHPLVLLEAMAYGRAIVATRAGGIPETIVDGVDGLLLDVGDRAALAAALVGLARDPVRARALGAAARSRMAQRGEHAMVDRLDELYRRLLGEHA